MKKNYKARIEKLGKQLGLPEVVYNRATTEDWEKAFKEAGGASWDERRRVHDSDNPELKNLPLIAPGGNTLATAKAPDGEWYILVQVRENGEKNEEDKEIGVPGGASNLWGYTPKGASKMNVVLEHPMLTAYREWKEEVGRDLPYDISILTVVTTTNHYAKFPDAYTMSTYYHAEISWEYMESLKNFGGSQEGKIKAIPISELPKYKWFPDVAEAFDMLMDLYL